MAVFFGVVAFGQGDFDKQRDLLLVQYDCKTDVDDLHSVAAFATLLSMPAYADIQYHAVAGTYGVQEGLYVPPNPLFALAFGNNWTDAHENMDGAVEKVKVLVEKTLDDGGDVWIAEAGQSDFTAKLIKAVQADRAGINTSERIHVVQHSDWNEEVTDAESLRFTRENSDYNKIPDGNATGNGTPGFRSPKKTNWQKAVSDPHLTEIWALAIRLANQYNGQEGRYNNEAIASGGLDFSDFSEVCWIMGLEDISDAKEFFARYSER